MTVIMSYHALVDRESKYVANYWKYIIILLLLAVSLTGFMGAFSFNYLVEKYNNNCILESELVFHRRVPPVIKPERISDRKAITEINKVFPLIDSKETMSKNENNETIKYNAYDSLYFFTMEIDENDSIWGKSCDYVKITPMLEGFFAIIWIAMFAICGSGGRTSSGIMPKPWRIVFPSIIFFMIIGILSTIHVIFLRVTIGKFCQQLQNQLAAEYSCTELMDEFSFNKNADNSSDASSNYTLAITMTSISTFLWIVTLVIMLLRCIFVIDFKLVKVIVTNPYEDKEKQTFKDVDITKTMSSPSLTDTKIIKDNTKHITFDYDSDESDETSFTTTVTTPYSTPPDK